VYTYSLLLNPYTLELEIMSTPLWRKGFFFLCRTLYSPAIRGNLFIVIYEILLIRTYYLGKEEWKYCSVEISASWILTQWSHWSWWSIGSWWPNYLFGEDNSMWRNICNGFYYQCGICGIFQFYTHIGYSTILSHSRLGHISRNGIKWLINSGNVNFSGRIMVTLVSILIWYL
jgi:hypothetical protein